MDVSSNSSSLSDDGRGRQPGQENSAFPNWSATASAISSSATVESYLVFQIARKCEGIVNEKTYRLAGRTFPVGRSKNDDFSDFFATGE